MVYGVHVQKEVYGGFPGDFPGSRFLNAKCHIYSKKRPHMAQLADEDSLHVEPLVLKGQRRPAEE